MGTASHPSQDPLCLLAATRRALAELKTRDFAAEYQVKHPAATWPEQTHDVPSLTDGRPYRVLSREDYNANERAFTLKHEARPRYELARMRAMRPVAGLALADMLATSQRCVNEQERLTAAMRWAA